MAQFTLGDIKYKQRAVNNMIHQEKLTKIGHLTQNHIQAHTHTYTNCGLQMAQFTLGGKNAHSEL